MKKKLGTLISSTTVKATERTMRTTSIARSPRLNGDKSCVTLFTLIISICLLVTSVQSQSSEVDPKRGSAQGASFSLSDIENINLTNGNLMLNMPLVSLPTSRGGLSGSLG
jgi:hypothetical protein